MADNETVERFVADTDEYVRRVREAARAADQWSDRTQAAGERARMAGHQAQEGAERAARAQREAARAAEEFARGEGSAERAAQQAARAVRELERAEIMQSRAARAAARAENEQADELERLGREAARAAAEQELARMRAMGQTEQHNNLLRRMTEQFGDMGRAGGRAFQMMEEEASFTDRTMGKLEESLGSLPKVAAILVLLPILAQAVGIALTLGIGGGLAAIGIMAAAKSKEVKEAFSGLAKDVGASLKDMAKPFEPELIKIAGIARKAFGEMAPFIGDAFKKIAPLITEFAQHAADSLKPFGPMIETATRKFDPLIKVLGQELPTLTGAMATAFEMMIEAADPDSLRMMVQVFAALILAIGQVIVVLERAGAQMATVYNWLVKLSTVGWQAWNSISEAATSAYNAISGGSGKTATALVQLDSTTNGLTTSQQQAKNSAAAWAAELEHLKVAMDQAAGKALTAREANRQYQQAVDDATEAVKKNGRTLDINSQKGRDNQATLDKIAQSALAARKAMDEKGTSDKAAARAADQARADFVRTAMAMNMSRARANELADQMGLLRGSILRVPSSKGVAVKQHGIGDAIAASKSLKSSLESLRNRDIYVTYHLQSTGNAIRNSKNLGYAAGIDSAPPGMAWVGERGPELMAFAGGEAIIDHLESMRIAAKAKDKFSTLPAPQNKKQKVVDGRNAYMPLLPGAMPRPTFKQLPKAPAAATVTYVTHNSYEIRGSVWAEKELLDVIQRQAAKRNIRNPGLAQFGGRGL